MKKHTRKKYILKANLIFTAALIIVNIIAFILSNGDKAAFTVSNIYVSVFTAFFHYFYLSSMYKDRLQNLKKEAAFTNYPFYIAVFFSCLGLMILSSYIALYTVNKEALNLTFVFTFFTSMIFSVFPAVLVLLFMYFIIPEFILPAITINDVRNTKRINISKLLFVIFLLISLYNGVSAIYKNMTAESREKFETARITMHFSTKYLKFDENINPYSKKKMLLDNVNIPFLYTKEPMSFKNYNDADRFCKALGARISNYIEAYYIAFNKFDTFGNKYYWISDTTGEKPAVLHFQNMSYTIEKFMPDTKPYAYCVADIDSKYGTENKKYFCRDIKQERQSAVEEMTSKPFDVNKLNSLIGKENQNTQNGFNSDNLIASEKKHINFSVKEVPIEVFNALLEKGYSYNRSISIRQDYETTDSAMRTRLNKDPQKKEIRLCYFPFSDYDGMSLYSEAHIYRQSYCSPAFELITPEPAIKTKYEKDAYCYSRGGRIPNIPELYGILKTFNSITPGIKYWTNNKIPEGNTDTTAPVLVYNEDSRFVKVHPVYSNENDSAYVYCIKASKNPSRVIANYKSRFEGIEGIMYAKQKCPNCVYYEMPDVVLRR